MKCNGCTRRLGRCSGVRFSHSVPLKIKIVKEGTKVMKVTLANGMTIEGTESQVLAAAKALGQSVGNDGVYYNSTSRGLVRIVDMDNNHLRNALLKVYREWVASLSGQSNTVVLNALRNGPSDKTFIALVAEFSRRMASGLI